MKHSKVIPLTVLSILFGQSPVVLSAADTPVRRIVYVGTYEKVESATGEHCSGYSIDLWKQNKLLFGLLHQHRGLCGDPPCGVLKDLEHSPETGVIRFKAETLEDEFHFSGSLDKNLLTGIFTKRSRGTDIYLKETVRLPRHRDEHLSGELNSLEKWHNVYDSISRCRGVRHYMPNR